MIYNKIKKRQIFLVTFGISIILFAFFAYFVIVVLKIRAPGNLYYSTVLLNTVFLTILLTDTLNEEYEDLSYIKNNLENEVIKRTGELASAKEEIEKKERQKTNYFINIAHETRTPLTLISNYLDEFINKNKDSVEIKIIKQNIDKLKNDMINFLDIEKLENGRIFYDHEQIVNFSEILETKILLFEKIAEKKMMKIFSDIEKSIILKIDPYALDRIINNLLDNAIKYSGKYDKVEVTLKTDNDKIIFIVADTGIGIPEGQIENIFKPYHQISHMKQNIQGMGMGLSIVKMIIDEINGEITTESRENEGTKFSILLNKYNIKNGERLNSDYDLASPNDNIPIDEMKGDIYLKEKMKILIIEDDRDMSGYLQKNLHDDYNIFLSANGMEALKKIGDIPKPDLIISDIMMDEMDGYEFYDELSKKTGYDGIPFIFLTAMSSKTDKLNGFKKGAVDHILKPFVIEELRNKINSLLNIIEKQNKRIINDMSGNILKLLQEKTGANNNKNNFKSICNDHNMNMTEKEIIKLLLKGSEYKEISAELDLSIGAVRKKIHLIYKKLNVQNKIELINIFNEE